MSEQKQPNLDHKPEHKAGLAEHPQVVFFKTLHRAAPRLSVAWWGLLLLGGVLPAVFALITGAVIDAIDNNSSLTGPLLAVAVVFTAMQVTNPLHVAIGQNLGRRAADWMNDCLIRATTGPPGLSHLEDPDLSTEMSMARDFDLGIMAPPLFVSMNFIAGGLRPLISGVSAAIVLLGFGWWEPLILVAGWGATHWLLKESGVWKDRNTGEVRDAQRHADYAYRLAVDAPAAKELRLFGLADWVVDRFAQRRRHLYDLQWEATRLRERSVGASLVAVAAANGLVFWRLAVATADQGISAGESITYLIAAITVSSIAFGGLNWALDAASAPAAAVERLAKTLAEYQTLSTAEAGVEAEVSDEPSRCAHQVDFTDLEFTYPSASAPVLSGLNLRIHAGESLAIVGQNGAGKTTLAKLLCRFYDPQHGSIQIDGHDLRSLDIDAWRSRVTAVFQDFVRYELPLRENVAPLGAPDELILEALEAAGATGLAELDTPLARGYDGGTELSGGQWQRVALARAICGVKQGAGLVLLDEPTAQLDVRGEAEIFSRLLEATSECTTILVSHRFSTVRLADRIAVVEGGRVIELGSHDELVALGRRYRTMYDLQASRFIESSGDLGDGDSLEIGLDGEVLTYDSLN
jgi:ABC-type multidrug transport system fused ATPase/permease subunit